MFLYIYKCQTYTWEGHVKGERGLLLNFSVGHTCSYSSLHNGTPNELGGKNDITHSIKRQFILAMIVLFGLLKKTCSGRFRRMDCYVRELQLCMSSRATWHYKNRLKKTRHFWKIQRFKKKWISVYLECDI